MGLVKLTIKRLSQHSPGTDLLLSLSEEWRAREEQEAWSTILAQW